MESVSEVVGYEMVLSQETGEHVGTRIYATRPMNPSAAGEGIEALRIYINTKYVQYTPALGDKIVAVTGRNGYVERIIKF